jgi:hypothetical protein
MPTQRMCAGPEGRMGSIKTMWTHDPYVDINTILESKHPLV